MTGLAVVADASRHWPPPARARARSNGSRMLRNLHADEVGVAALWLTGETGRDRLGVGPAQVRGGDHASAGAAPADHRRDPATPDGHRRHLRRRQQGPAAQALSALFAAASASEQQFLARLMLGELRQGALAALVVDAIALAFDIPAASVRRAWMLRGDIAEVAVIARRDGRAGLDGLGLRCFARCSRCWHSPPTTSTTRWRIDRPDPGIQARRRPGADSQARRRGAHLQPPGQRRDRRAARDRRIDRRPTGAELVLDGETLALAADGGPLPFQTTMRRFGRHSDDPTCARNCRWRCSASTAWPAAARP
jgi:DNA ligase-1